MMTLKANVECRYAECRMSNVVMLGVIMHNVVALFKRAILEDIYYLPTPASHPPSQGDTTTQPYAITTPKNIYKYETIGRERV
jgi:hypothetical protein